jgi:hypothetical protein
MQRLAELVEVIAAVAMFWLLVEVIAAVAMFWLLVEVIYGGTIRLACRAGARGGRRAADASAPKPRLEVGRGQAARSTAVTTSSSGAPPTCSHASR